MLEFDDASDAGTISMRQSHPKLLMRARLDKNIIQTSLLQIDKEGKWFVLDPLWPYLIQSQTITMRWWNKNRDPQTCYTSLQGLEYRLAQAYTAWYLMNTPAR